MSVPVICQSPGTTYIRDPTRCTLYIRLVAYGNNKYQNLGSTPKRFRPARSQVLRRTQTQTQRIHLHAHAYISPRRCGAGETLTKAWSNEGSPGVAVEEKLGDPWTYSVDETTPPWDRARPDSEQSTNSVVVERYKTGRTGTMPSFLELPRTSFLPHLTLPLQRRPRRTPRCNLHLPPHPHHTPPPPHTTPKIHEPKPR